MMGEASGTAPPAKGAVTVSLDEFDPSLLGAAVTGTQLEHVFKGGADFHGTLIHKDFSGISFDAGRYAAPLFALGELPRDYITIGCILDCRDQVTINGRTAQAHDLLCLTSGSELAFSTKAAATWCALQLPIAVIEEQAPGLAGGSMSVFDVRNTVPLPFAHLLRSVVTGADGSEFIEPLVRAFLLLTGEDCREKQRRGHQILAVRKACEYIRGNIAGDIKVNDLCVATGLPLRTLERAFKQITGCTPNTVIRLCRMQLVHERLLEAGPDSASVTGIALDCGITHLGRFPSLYRAIYGALPSQTLARSPARRSRWAGARQGGSSPSAGAVDRKDNGSE